MSVAPDSTSLSRLHDIVVPAPVSWWPLAPFWQFLAIVLCVGLLWAAWRTVRRHRRNAYRRAALQELAALQRDPVLTDAQRIAEVATLLRRTALSAWPRQQIVALTGNAWLAFLDGTGRGREFTDGPGRWLTRAPYDPAALIPAAETTALVDLAAAWINGHRGDGTRASLTADADTGAARYGAGDE